HSGATPMILGALVSLLGTDGDYARMCRSLVAWAEGDGGWVGILAAAYCAHRANTVFDEHAATLVAYVDHYLSEPHPPGWALSYGALVHYRAGNRERSLALLKQSPYKSYEAPLHALLAHQAGDTPTADKFLQHALTVAGEYEASLEPQS